MRSQSARVYGRVNLLFVLLLAGLPVAHVARGQATSASSSAAAPEDAEILSRGAKAQALADQGSALGSYYDPQTREHVLVIGSDQVLRADGAARTLGGPVGVRQLPISKMMVESLRQRVIERDFHPDAKKYTYGGYLDLKTGKMVVYSDAPRHVTESLVAEYAGHIDLRYGSMALDKSRELDTEKFYGGASIRNTADTAHCSSGFTIQDGVSSITHEGFRYQVTAGHCFPQGASVYTSGSIPYGYVINGANWGSANFKDVETLRLIVSPLDNTGATYDRRIWVGGAISTSWAWVHGGNNPVVGYGNYCRSGQTTGEHCLYTATSLDGFYVDDAGQLNKRMIVYQGATASAGGDSGAPIYVYSVGGGGVHIRGIHTAIAVGSDPPTMFGVRFWDVMTFASGTLLCSGTNNSCYVQPD